MGLWETFRGSLDALWANTLRSLLTMLGVIIGIAAVIAMMALGEGAQRSVEERLRSLGTNVLTVRPGQMFMGGVSRGQSPLTVKEADALVERAPSLAAVSPELESRLQVEHGQRNANLSVVGVWSAFFTVNDFRIGQGRLFTEAEERGRRRVAVIGSAVAQQLRTQSDAMMSNTVRIGGTTFEVVGVLSEKGAQGFSNPDEAVYVPLATAQFRLMGTDRIRSISVQVADGAPMDEAMLEIDTALRRERKLRPGVPSDFTIRDQATLLNTMKETTQTFSFLLAGIAAISLLVGGIGIMNIMLVSVTERTREIGLRKALGARRFDILLQFLIESLVLCTLGGVLGIALGVGGSHLLNRFAGWQTVVAPEAVLLALGFSAAVGIFFGLWPARRAAQLAPIEALRYE